MLHRNADERALRKSLPTLFALLLLATAASSSNACAVASPPDAHIDIAQEYAVIVWDAATHTEHFIRNATFHADAKDFGFLVPSPSIPTLAIEDDSLFSQLDRVLLPKHETRTKTVFDFSPLLTHQQTAAGVAKTDSAMLKSAPMPAGATSASAVRVLASQQIGTYDTVVLEADDAGALNHWLAAHGYASRPALTAWLEPYIAAHWKITAFKIAASQNVSENTYRWGVVNMPPIRMSFQTQRPFYPYREPSQETYAQREDVRLQQNADSTDMALTRPQREPASRLLRVYMLSSERMQGAFEEKVQASFWPGNVVWTDSLPVGERDSLAATINAPRNSEGQRIAASTRGATLPANTRLTVFEDRSFPRPGIADVFFDRSNDQSSITPPPIIDYDVKVISIPADVAAVLLLGMGGAGFYARRLRASRRSYRSYNRAGKFTTR